MLVLFYTYHATTRGHVSRSFPYQCSTNDGMSSSTQKQAMSILLEGGGRVHGLKAAGQRMVSRYNVCSWTLRRKWLISTPVVDPALEKPMR
ncbi:hypothetical protein CGRA01v4_01858 [Colletotrichum graminicola]|nr:hypothetical protein CGRA01v4_01858 [Colletotrichum graminicola]